MTGFFVFLAALLGLTTHGLWQQRLGCRHEAFIREHTLQGRFDLASSCGPGDGCGGGGCGGD